MKKLKVKAYFTMFLNMCYSGSSGVGAWIHCIIASSCFLFYISKTDHEDTSNTPGFQLHKFLQTLGYVSNAS